MSNLEDEQSEKNHDLQQDCATSTTLDESDASENTEPVETEQVDTDPKAEQCDPEATDYKAKYLRLLAENENLVRRLRKESRDSTRFALQRIMLDLLSPLDQFEMALSHANNNPSEEVKNWAIGFKMISKQFREWLSSQDVYRFKSLGEKFDSTLHEATETIETTEHDEDIIIKELLCGYKMGEAILRPARVVVAKAPAENSDASSNEKAERTN
mgnify:FL=1